MQKNKPNQQQDLLPTQQLETLYLQKEREEEERKKVETVTVLLLEQVLSSNRSLVIFLKPFIIKSSCEMAQHRRFC